MEGEIVDLGVALEIISKSGAWFSYNGDRLGQGRDNTKEFIRTHPELKEELFQKIMENKDQLIMSSRKAKKEAVQRAALSQSAPAPAPAEKAPAEKAAAKAPVSKAGEVTAKSVAVEADEADFES